MMTSEANITDPISSPNERVKNDLTKSFSVSSSAGCGKTHILITRVLALLEQGIDLEKLLLLTFTENAAREMRIRLLGELNKLPECDWRNKAIEQLPNSSIQTINSFALGIVKSNFLNLLLSAEPNVLDEVALKTTLESEFDDRYNYWANNEIHSTYFALSSAIGINRVSMKEMTYKVESVTPIHSEIDVDFSSLNLKLGKAINNLEAICRPQLDRLIMIFENYDTSNIGKEPLKRLLAIHDFASNCIDAEDSIDFFQAFSSHRDYITDVRLSMGKRGENEPFEECFDIIREQIQIDLVKIKDLVLTYCSNLLVEFVQLFRKSRYTRGEITHDECLTLANVALRDEPTRYDVWKQYASILVDEFQDTDDVQIEILNALSEKDEDINIGRLFIVGDAKQSIYGFRGAKVDSYQKFIAQADIENIYLDKSYRTLDSVLHPINEVSKVLIQDYREMQSNRSSENTNGELNSHVRLLGGKIDDQVEEIRKVRSNDIALAISEYLGLEIGKNGNRRKSSFSDIALLLRNSTGVGELLSELKAHKIPHAVDSVDLIWDLTFTKMTLAIISAIADPEDFISIVGTLKSPIFQCTNDDLIEWVNFVKENEVSSSEIWNYKRISVENPDSKVSASFKALQKLNSEYTSRFPSELLTKLHFNSGMIESFEEQEEYDGESISRYFIELAHHFEENFHERSLLKFIKYVEEIRMSNKSPVKFRSLHDSDTVKIMTIHKSKGLEFPIVFVVPSIVHNQNKDKYAFENNFDNEQNQTPLLYFNSKVKHSGIDDSIDLKKTEKTEEETRLIYVAMTRAEDYLVLCTHEKKSKTKRESLPGGGVAMLNYAIDKSGIDGSLEPLNCRNSGKKLKKAIEHARTSKHQKVLDISKLAKFNTSIRQNEIITPSSIDDESQLENEKYEMSLKSKITDQSKSHLVGSALHRALQIVPFSANETTIMKISESCANRFGIQEHTQDISKLISKALSHQKIKGAKIAFREVPISGYKNGNLIEGFIDLLIKDDQGWTIIDYKTDTISKAFTIESKIQKYKPQLETYRFLLENEHGYKINTMGLMFLNSPEDCFVEIA